jgi:hypothetical protein
VAALSADVLAVRTRPGVLAFGSDSAVRSVFGSYGIDDFDLHTIEVRRLRFDSGERGLLRDALARALQRDRGLKIVRQSVSSLLTPSQPDEARWGGLRKIVGLLRGSVPGHSDLIWQEGIGIRLEWAEDQLWLVFEPRTVFEGITDVTKAVAADFGRERTVRRYNSVLNDLIAFWAKHLAGDGREIHALGISDGVEAAFSLSKDTAFSRRGGA